MNAAFQQISDRLELLKNRGLSRDRIVLWFGLLLMATCMAGAQFTLIQESLGPDITSRVEDSAKIIDGMPHLKTYQARVIGPYTVEGLHLLTGWDFRTSYQVTTFLLLVVFFLALLAIARSIWKSDFAALGIVMAAGLLNAILMQGKLLMIWDYFNLIFALFLIWSLLSDKPLWFICLVITAGIFNHPMALLACGWLAIDSLIFFKREGKLPKPRLKLHWQQLALAAGLGISGFFLLRFITYALFVIQLTDERRLQSVVDEFGARVYFLFQDNVSVWSVFNLDMLKASLLFDPDTSFFSGIFGITYPVIYTPVYLIIPAIIVWAICSRNTTLSRIGLLFIMYWGSVFILNPIYETRSLLPFVPFLVLTGPILFVNRFGNPGLLRRNMASNIDNRLGKC